MKNNKIKNWLFLVVISLAVFLPVVGQAQSVCPRQDRQGAMIQQGQRLIMPEPDRMGEIQAVAAW